MDDFGNSIERSMSAKGKAPIATGPKGTQHITTSLRVKTEMPKNSKSKAVQERQVTKTPLDLFNAMPYCQVNIHFILTILNK